MSSGRATNDSGMMDLGVVFRLRQDVNATNSSRPADELDDDRTLMRWVVYNMDLYLVPVIILVGVVGNAISFFAFCLTPLKVLSSSVYLAALAASDNGFLLCVFGGWLVNVNFSFYRHQGLCQTFIYLTYVFGFLSVWYVVAFTVERYIAVCCPFRRSAMCTTRRAKIVVSAMAAVALVAYNPMLWTSNVDASNDLGVPFCHVVPEHEWLVEVLNYVDTVATLVIPSAAIIVINTRIVHNLMTSYKRNKEISGIAPSDACHWSDAQRTFSYRRTEQNAQITRLLLVVSTIFVVLNLPGHVLRIHLFIMQIVDPNTQPSINYQQLKIIFQHIYYLNFCINFVLYSLCGKNFRKALRLLCSCGADRQASLKKRKVFRASSSGQRTDRSSSRGEGVAMATTAFDGEELAPSNARASEGEKFICLERNDFTPRL